MIHRSFMKRIFLLHQRASSRPFERLLRQQRCPAALRLHVPPGDGNGAGA